MGTNELYIGLMSGTSADSIDAAIVNLGSKTPELIGTHSIDLAAKYPELKTEIHALAIPGDNELHRVNQLDRAMGLLFAQVTNELLEQQGFDAGDIQAIGSHGQTVRHYPTANAGSFAYTVQVGDPNTIAQLTGITTVADFRRRDIVLGGQGAPLVPAFHQTAFEKAGTCRAIINIGGMANLTLLPGQPPSSYESNSSPLLGYDTGPGNGLMDKWIKRHQGKNYDDRGTWASQGQVHVDLLATLMKTPYLSQPPPKSTGPELFNEQWLAHQLQEYSAITPVDVQATLLEFTAKTITEALISHTPTPTEVYFCGGGTYNTTLIQRLETLLHPRLIASTDQLGIPPGWVEAAAFAWLAKQTINGKPGNAPSVTGAEKPSILGAIFPAQ